MKIWVDADACPVVVKEMLFRAAERTQTQVTLVANHSLQTPPSKFIDFLHVEKGFDVADNVIVERIQANDLLISNDIPLVAEAVEKGAVALGTRGELYTENNIKARLDMRDFMEILRSTGVDTGGPAAISQADKQNFANQLDRWLVKKRTFKN